MSCIISCPSAQHGGRLFSKLSTKINFFKVQALEIYPTTHIVPGFTRGVHSAGNSSCQSNPQLRNIDKGEPCFVTGAVLYTHERAHWVNAARGDDSEKADVESLIAHELGLSDDRDFDLDGIENLTHLSCHIHAALDRYAFIAVTGSRETLIGLKGILTKNNAARQQAVDSNPGSDPGRDLDFLHPSFQDPSYELVVLHPDHFLPPGHILTRYNGSEDNTALIAEHYAIAGGELVDHPNGSKKYPSFKFTYPRDGPRPNPLLIILNAQIKIRRYESLLPAQPQLPADTQELMQLTTELVNLVYWEPVGKIFLEQRWNDDRAARRLGALDYYEDS